MSSEFTPKLFCPYCSLPPDHMNRLGWIEYNDRYEARCKGCSYVEVYSLCDATRLFEILMEETQDNTEDNS